MDNPIREIDVALWGTGTSQEELVDSISQYRQACATFTGDRHHDTDPSILARKWGIGLQKAKDTLKCTTQMNMRSAVLPLTRRYRTDLLSPRLRRLSNRFVLTQPFPSLNRL